MKEFKFLKIPQLPTLQEKIDYAWEFSKPYRFHDKGCLISKSVYRTFVIPEIKEKLELTYDDIEKLILDNCIDPNRIVEQKYYIYVDGYLVECETNRDPYEDIYIETVHNEENLPYFYLDRFYLDRYKVDPWEEDQDRNTEENEIKLFNEDK